MPDDRTTAPLVACVVALLAILVFLPAARHPFTMYDDPVYVTENPEVKDGLTARSIAWAFTSGDASNWHPVTWLSHLLDVQIFGLRPGPHHLVSVVLHALNAALLVLVLSGMTGRTSAAALVAAIFALHPLRVESVAWVSERKDVLSAFFFLLTLLAYAHYTKGRGRGRYAIVLACFVLALLAKPMTVTTPVVLLLLDLWPLRRLDPRAPWRGESRVALLEKLPLFALSAAVACVTVIVQRRGGALDLLEPIPFLVRAQNAVVACVEYLGTFLWPAGLAVFYPYRYGGPSQLLLGACGLLLASLSVGAVLAWRRFPYLATGWGWFGVMLLPVLGLIQAGAQARADRYTYLPLVGVTIALVWGVGDLLRALPESPGPHRAWIGGTLAALALVSLGTLTVRQLGFWRSDVALFGRAVAVTRDNFIAHNNLGIALAQEGRFAEAAGQHRAAIAIKPDWSEVYKFHAALASELMAQGHFQEALDEYRQVLRLEPRHAVALNDVGILLARLGRPDQTLVHYEQAVQLLPDDPMLRVNLARTLIRFGRREDAARQLRAALEQNPGHPVAAAELQSLP